LQYYTRGIIWWYYTTIRNNYTLYNYCIIGKCAHGLRKRFDSCPTHRLTIRSCLTYLERSPKTRKRMPLVAALKIAVIALTFLVALTALLTRISSTRRWWTRVTSSIEVDSNCCIIQSNIIRYYTMQSSQVPIIQNSKPIPIM